VAYQEQSNGYTAFKVQSGQGVQASGSGGKILRQTGGAGGKLTKAATESAEVRSDMMSSRGRHGVQKTAGAYSSELTLGTFDDIFEAVMRGTWGSANLELDESDFTSITTGANTIVLASGSPIALGLRVGDVIRITNQATSTANNGKNLRITGLDATTITVAETLIVNAVADTACEITRPGRVLIAPAAPVKRYFTVEEYEADIDSSEVFTDCVWGSIKFTMAPNGLVTIDTTWVGTGQFETLTDSGSPLLTSPTVTTSQTMSALEATVRLGSSDLIDLTAFDLTIDITPSAPDVIASRYSPAVFTGSMAVSLNLTSLRSDLLDVADFLDETQLSLHILCVEPETEPKDFVSLFVPNFTLGSVDKSALAKAGGGRTQSLTVPAALVGKDERGGAFDASMIKIQTSNAS